MYITAWFLGGGPTDTTQAMWVGVDVPGLAHQPAFLDRDNDADLLSLAGAGSAEAAELLGNRIGSDIIVIDDKGEILFWERGFGAAGAAREHVGQNLRELFPNLSSEEEGIDWELEIFTHVLKEGRPAEIRKMSRQVGQTLLWFDIYL